MQTDSNLNSDELMELVQDFLSFYEMDHLVSSLLTNGGCDYQVHLDRRFHHPLIVAHEPRVAGNEPIFTLKTRAETPRDALLALLNALREAAPQFEDVAV